MSAKNFMKQFLQDELGATAVEYGLIISLIVIAMVAALQDVANETVSMWSDVETKVADAGS